MRPQPSLMLRPLAPWAACLFGELTELPPASETLPTLFPLLRALSCQALILPGLLSPGLGLSPWAAGPTTPPPQHVPSQALITQVGALFFESFLTAVAVSLCAYPTHTAWHREDAHGNFGK